MSFAVISMYQYHFVILHLIDRCDWPLDWSKLEKVVISWLNSVRLSLSTFAKTPPNVFTSLAIKDTCRQHSFINASMTETNTYLFHTISGKRAKKDTNAILWNCIRLWYLFCYKISQHLSCLNSIRLRFFIKWILWNLLMKNEWNAVASWLFIHLSRAVHFGIKSLYNTIVVLLINIFDVQKFWIRIFYGKYTFYHNEKKVLCFWSSGAEKYIQIKCWLRKIH